MMVEYVSHFSMAVTNWRPRRVVDYLVTGVEAAAAIVTADEDEPVVVQTEHGLAEVTRWTWQEGALLIGVVFLDE